MSGVEDDRQRLRRLIDGFQVSQAISVIAQLGLPDRLPVGGEADVASVDELACDFDVDPVALYRVLRALATVDIVHELDGRRFTLTTLGAGLRSDAPASMSGWAAWVGRTAYWSAWGALAHSVRTGENAFASVHGEDVWAYRSTRPEESAAFDRAMVSLASQTPRDALRQYDFSRFGTIADVGGGVGVLLAAILSAAPEACGVLFDQPHVVAAAPALLERAGVAERCTVVGGSFFDGVPSGADAYVLRAVIHDWDDDDAVRILQRVRAAIPDDGTLVLVERVVAGPNDGAPAKWSDLNMLVGPGGRERTQAEFDELFRRAGFAPTRTVPAGLHGFLEARPVAPTE